MKNKVKFKDLKDIDKLTYALTIMFEIITIFVVSYFIIFFTMHLMNTQEYSKILIDANMYQGFYKILNIITTMALPILVCIVISIIPYLIISILLCIFYIRRYIQFQGEKKNRIIAILGLIILSSYLIIKGFSMYPLNGKYEIEVNSKISQISNVEVKEYISTYLKEDYYIYNIEIYHSFPDDFDGVIYYKDIVKKEKSIFLSDSGKDYEFIKNNAENNTNEYTKKAIIMLVTGDIIYITFIIFTLKELKRISKKDENINIEEIESIENIEDSTDNDKKFIYKILITILLIGTLLGIIIVILESNRENGKTNINGEYENQTIGYEDKSDVTTNSDILYEKKLNENTIIRVKNLGAILAQRSVINIEKSTDNGKTYIGQTEEGITIHNGAEFVFLDENIGFINDPGLAGTGGENRGFLVTTDGGKTFSEANIIHPLSIEEKNLLVKGVPYIKDGKLNVQIYTLNHSKYPERTYYEFTSNNGLTWKYNYETVYTSEQLKKYEKDFNTFGINGFIVSTNTYNKPSEIDLEEVFYSGAGFNNEITKEELEEYKKVTKYHETDMVKITTKQAEELYYNNTGEKLWNLKERLKDWTYIEKYDAYYNEVSDTNFESVSCIEGIMNEEHKIMKIQLSNNRTISVKIDYDKGTHYIISNKSTN